MVSRDGASSVQGQMIRITPLLTDGSIDTTKPVLTTKGFITASFAPEYEDGDEISEKNASGGVCISWKAPDTLKRLSFNLSLCSPDPEAAAMLAGGKMILDAAKQIIGYTSPIVGATADNPVAIELWSIANMGGKAAGGTPYWHWVFPFVKVRYDGSREFSNSALANEFSGQALGNAQLVPAGLTDPGDDYVTYKQALVNPFSYVRTAALPAEGWSGLFSPSAANSINYTPPVPATGVTAGTPGTFTGVGGAAADVPADLAALTLLGIGSGGAWTAGQYVLLGDGSKASWSGAPGSETFVAGGVPNPPVSLADPVGMGNLEFTWVAGNTAAPTDGFAVVGDVNTAEGNASLGETSAWTTGQFAYLADGVTKVHWDNSGSTWATGATP